MSDTPAAELAADLAAELIARCRAAGLRLVTAESCTGGLISAALTDVPGASRVFDRGFVTYSNQAKTDLLGVPPFMLKEHGAVSAQVAEAMAAGARVQSGADLAVAVTGIAGPGGATPDKPVGLVYIATASKGQATEATRHDFPGDRTAVRGATVAAALRALLDRLP